MRSDITQLLIGSFVIFWMMVEWVALWRDRPAVVWDPHQARWRAQRGLERRPS